MPNFEKFPIAFVIALLLIFIFELANAYFDDYFYSPVHEGGIGLPFEGLRLKLKNEISQLKEFNFDVLILGDSHNQVSIMPSIIEKETGLTCFNFATFGAQAVMGSYWIFENYLNTHSVKPKYIIVGFVPFYTYPIEKAFVRETALTRGLSDLKKGNAIKFIKEFGIAQGIKFMLPSLKHQGRFRKFIKNPFAFKMPGKKQIQDIVEQVYRDKGYYPERVNESYPPDAVENGYRNLLKYTDPDRFVISPFSEKYLRGILDLAVKNKIRIIYNITPIPPYLSEVVKDYPYLSQYNDFVNSLKEEYPDFYVVNPQGIINKNDMYVDVNHLNGKGTPIQSAFLAQKIKELELSNKD